MLAKPRSAVAGTLHAPSDHLLRCHLAVARQSKKCHQVDEECGRVQHPAMLAGRVIRREHVMVVVISLTAGAECHAGVLPWVDAPVVRPVAPQMSDAVNCPRHVENGDVAQDSTREERRPRALTPVMDRNVRRENETKQNHRWHIQPVHSIQLSASASIQSSQFSGT